MRKEKEFLEGDELTFLMYLVLTYKKKKKTLLKKKKGKEKKERE